MMANSNDGMRRGRHSIASQACETCRSRKSRCDEQRPKCGLCERLDAVCEYREPLPTKKDKTLVKIQEQLSRIESKTDATSANLERLLHDSGKTQELSDVLRQYGSRGAPSQSSMLSDEKDSPDYSSTKTYSEGKEMQRLTAPHKILLWPYIYSYLTKSEAPVTADLQAIRQKGTAWFVDLDRAKHVETLFTNDRLPSFIVNGQGPMLNEPRRVGFPSLSIQYIQKLTSAYFNTFNALFPILDRDTFSNKTVSRVLTKGYGDNDSGAVLALMVFALGEVAIRGVHDLPIRPAAPYFEASGFRGGTAERPPGLAIYNEARSRLGFISTQCTLELVQIALLQALYLETNARHLDFWSSAVSASETCQVLIKCQNIDWSTLSGDLIKRAYWSCILCEDFFHLELDLPRTSIYDLEDKVPWPYSHAASGHDSSSNLDISQNHFQLSFLAMIHLRKLIARVQDTIHDCEWTIQGHVPDLYMDPPETVIREMDRQLESWRLVLPKSLQWTDDDKAGIFEPNKGNFHGLDEVSSAPHRGSDPTDLEESLDIINSQLRARYYYARYMIYRPFIYKALHFANSMTSEDARCCALAIESACLWPIALAPLRCKRRLIPYLFVWTQNFVGILLILRMTTENECLSAVCEEHFDFATIKSTAMLMLEWIHDLSQVDGIAEWAWKIVEPLYSQWLGAKTNNK